MDDVIFFVEAERVKELVEAVKGQVHAPFAVLRCRAGYFGKREVSRSYTLFGLVLEWELSLRLHNGELGAGFEVVGKAIGIIHRSLRDSLGGFAANRGRV